MGRAFSSTTLGLLLAASALGACDSVTVERPCTCSRLFPERGVMRGTVTYEGPHPCSSGGHVVGSAILLVFKSDNPPPPAGLATSVVSFATVPGDVLFPDEPRNAGSDVYCPKDHGDASTVTTSAPFDIAPLDAGSYIIAAFYDVGGEFFPTFSFRNLPRAGDVAGGVIDLTDAAKHAGDPNYRPLYQTIVVGEGGAVVSGLVATMAATLPFTRPYFYLDAPITMTQDHHILAMPQVPTPALIQQVQESFVSLQANWGVAQEELATAVDPRAPFHLQIAPPPRGGLLVWSQGTSIPETAGQPITVPQLWPQIALMKLDEAASADGLVVQGSDTKPLVIMQAITLWEDSLFASAAQPPSTTPGAANLKDHVRALVRPSVLCLDPRDLAAGGILVTPHVTGKSPDEPNADEKALFDPATLKDSRVREVRLGCLPTGKYGVSLVYPTGQAWSVPNEVGACTPPEGPWDTAVNPSTCTLKPRPVLASQGIQTVLQIVPPTTPEGQTLCARDAPVPAECLQNPK